MWYPHVCKGCKTRHMSWTFLSITSTKHWMTRTMHWRLQHNIQGTARNCKFTVSAPQKLRCLMQISSIPCVWNKSVLSITLHVNFAWVVLGKVYRNFMHTTVMVQHFMVVPKRLHMKSLWWFPIKLHCALAGVTTLSSLTAKRMAAENNSWEIRSQCGNQLRAVNFCR